MTNRSLKRLVLGLMASALIAALAGPAAAQIIIPGTAPSSITPPPPPPSAPPPVITVPVVPKLADPPPLTHERIQPAPDLPKAQLRRGRSFGDRIQDCLNDSTAAQLNSTDRAAYSRACAQQ
ncbi:hypothetical protein [Rhodopseudomonas sp. BR0G17]|uniref:hypothetical protein n=1 Tax=Rhodopseudomonas sp. BR0G17 TaxID=2269368 RepID=UPI001FEED031|nr:hypothetical protein [Rhodopseudomonas sp. BR0G17]